MRLPGDIRPLSKPIRTQCETLLQPFCLCCPLFCERGNEFWRFTANRWYQCRKG
ncbi:hypothetical protein E2C01_014145 [Portunus trituberculatus]|uniref:Uncharacterized protein n=1 Tax=Portunus trituberculatus TaxID=210409 RepID=A0A5B7DJC0_PORTR|nr:hypothetical protein [Portunus trituberculatus]